MSFRSHFIKIVLPGLAVSAVPLVVFSALLDFVALPVVFSALLVSAVLPVVFSAPLVYVVPLAAVFDLQVSASPLVVFSVPHPVAFSAPPAVSAVV